MADKELVERFFKAAGSFHPHEKRPKRVSDHMRGEPMVLHGIHAHGDKITPGELNRELHMSTAQVAAVLRNLEKKEFITRTTDTKDKRKSWISLTEKGRTFTEEAEATLRRNVTEMLDYIGEEDAKEFIRILEKLKDFIPTVPNDLCE